MKEKAGLLVIVALLAGFMAGCPAPTPQVIEKEVIVEVTRVVDVASEPTSCAAGVMKPATEVTTLHSSLADRDYTLYVALPPNYSRSDETYPVVYLLDGKLWSSLASDIGRLLRFEGEVPKKTLQASFCKSDFILVGVGCEVGWTGSLLEQQAVRGIDLTPTVPEDPAAAGGAGEFLTFVRQTIIPYIDDNYRTDPTDRTIAGCSAGGMFAGYVLFPPTETLIGMAPQGGLDLRRRARQETAEPVHGAQSVSGQAVVDAGICS